MPSNPSDWSSRGRQDSAFRRSQANALPNTIFPGETDTNRMKNLGLVSYGPPPAQWRSGGENLLIASSPRSIPPHNQSDDISLHQIRKSRSYDRPGKKPAVPYTRDPLELQALCKRRGGSDFAVDWIMVAFKHDVSLDALLRTLSFAEVENVNRSTTSANGFKLRQAYDGFLAKIGHDFECGLCEEGNRTHWVHKRDAVRHLRKFHFGLADRCRIW